MKSTPENKVKAKLKKYLDALKPDMYYYSATAGYYSTRGVSDIICCYKGCFLGIEVKAPGRRAEPHRGLSGLQIEFFKGILHAGGSVLAFDGGDDDWNDLHMWIQSVDNIGVSK